MDALDLKSRIREKRAQWEKIQKKQELDAMELIMQSVPEDDSLELLDVSMVPLREDFKRSKVQVLHQDHPEASLEMCQEAYNVASRLGLEEALMLKMLLMDKEQEERASQEAGFRESAVGAKIYECATSGPLMTDLESISEFKSKAETKSPRGDLWEIERYLEQEQYGLELLKWQKSMLEYRAANVKRSLRNRDFDDLVMSVTILEKELEATMEDWRKRRSFD